MQATADPGSTAGELAAPPSPSGRQTVLVALGQGALLVFGAVLALLVAQLFGKTVDTDAFFAAYGVYGVGLNFGQSFRLTAVARLVTVQDRDLISQLLGAVAVMALVVAIPMVVLAAPVGTLLVTTDPHGVATDTLRILWVALTGQLLGAMLATVLATRGAFTTIGVVTLSSGLVSVGVFVAVEAALGITAAAVALAVSAAWVAACMASWLTRSGWRPRIQRQDLAAMVTEAGRLIAASATFIGATICYVVCVAMAAHRGPGDATLFAYGYVLAVMLVGVTSNVAAMLQAPGLAASAERLDATATVGVSTVRFTLILAGPILALTALAGSPVIGFVLGSGFDNSDTTTIVLSLLCLSGWILASASGIFAVVELLARGQLLRLAALAAAQIAGLFALAVLGGAIAGVPGIATALSLSMLAATVVQLRWAFGRAWVVPGRRMLAATAREAGTLAAAFAVPTAIVLAWPDRAGAIVTAALLATASVVVATRSAWPAEFAALVGIVRRQMS